MDAQIKADYMREEVVVAHVSSSSPSNYGDDASPGPKVRVLGYIERTSMIVTTPRGEKVQSDTLLVLDANDFDIDEDREHEGLFEFLWLPRANSSNDDQARRPKKVTRCKEEFDVTSHWEIRL